MLERKAPDVFKAEEMRRVLERFPFLSQEDLCKYCNKGSVSSSLSEIEVGKILGTGTDENWQDLCGGDEYSDAYIESFVRSVQSGVFSYKQNPPLMVEAGGAYFVETDGRHRVAIAKFLGLPKIHAYINKTRPTVVFTDSIEEYDEMEGRRKMGLWNGQWRINPLWLKQTLEEKERFENEREKEIERENSGDEGIFGGLRTVLQTFTYATAGVLEHEGIWVFSEDMVKTKILYKQIGASGK